MEIFISPTPNPLIQLFRTAVTGVITFVADAGLLFIITECGVHYMISAAFSFVVAFFMNFYLVREFVFPKSKKTFAAELGGYAAIALICLGLTEGCLYVFTEKFGIYYILSKFLAAVVVLAFSFAARKFWLYKQ
jgi:putative flippase GtrA